MTPSKTILKGGIKGVNAPENDLLTGAIEPEVKDKFMGEEMVGFEEKFLVQRKIGGRNINGRKIKGWKEVPTVLNWDSTYRRSEWQNNFDELAEIFSENNLSQIIKTGDLNKQEKQFNHALIVFINSFLTIEKQCRESYAPDPLKMLETLEFDGYVQRHAEYLFLEETIKNKNEDQKFQRIKVGASQKLISYDSTNVTTYEQIVDLFFTYINRMEDTYVKSADLAGETINSIDVMHRWKEHYTEKMLAKFKDLSDSRFGDMWTTMLTLTTYQDSDDEPETPENWQKLRGASWFEAMERLKESLDKVLKVLREIARREIECDFHYIWIVEAHKSGYPHIHIGIFGDVSEWLDDYSNKLRVQELLEEKYDLGKSGVATEFDTKPPSGDGSINELSNYLMKYFKKNFGEIKSKYNDEDLSDKEWGTLVYNACMWLSGYRTWGKSNSVGEVMKSESSEDTDKNYVSLGGELNADEDTNFEDEIRSKGSSELVNRIEKRKEFRNAVKKRKES